MPTKTTLIEQIWRRVFRREMTAQERAILVVGPAGVSESNETPSDAAEGKKRAAARGRARVARRAAG